MSVTKLMTVEEMQGDRAKWLELRRTGIGGSEASVVVGENRYRSLFSLWMDKTGQLENNTEVTPENEERMQWGTNLEPVIAEEFSRRTGKKVQRCGMLRSNEHPFMIADVDRLVVGENAILEIKTTASWNKDEWADDAVPPEYIIQGLHYMAVTGAEKCYFACLVGGQRMLIREVAREDEEIDALIEAERLFWEEYVLTKRMPDPDGTARCTECIKKLFGGGDEEAKEFDGSIDDEIDAYFGVKEQIKTLEAIALEKENKVRAAMENSEFGRSPKYNIFYKSSYVRTDFDKKQFAKAYPDLYERFKKETPYRRLMIRKSVARARERGEL